MILEKEITDALHRGDRFLPLGLTEYDYMDLALACLDQAGLRAHHLSAIVNIIRQRHQEYPNVDP